MVNDPVSYTVVYQTYYSLDNLSREPTAERCYADGIRFDKESSLRELLFYASQPLDTGLSPCQVLIT
jgi:hypothetical protein